MNREPELKPCPFCGGPAQILSGGPGCHYVRCEGCSATSDDRSRSATIEAWNTRAALSAPKAEAVTVKPLAWKLMDDGATYHAQSIVGRWAKWEGYYLPPDGYRTPCDDPEAAAQADYEARILSAIDTSPVPALTDEEKRIAEIIEEESTGGACCGWSPCSGCHETSEGAETGFYPFSRTFQCHVGGGCHECGGLGVVWQHYSERDLRLMEAEPASALTDEAVERAVELTYRNWRGKVSTRRLSPERIWYGSTEWHPEPQWLLRAYDHEKQAHRDFALKDFGIRALTDEAMERTQDSLLDALRENSWDLKCFDMPTGQGDADIGWRVVEHHMAKPHERVVAEVYVDDPASAIRAALLAAFPSKGEGE